MVRVAFLEGESSFPCARGAVFEALSAKCGLFLEGPLLGPQFPRLTDLCFALRCVCVYTPFWYFCRSSP